MAKRKLDGSNGGPTGLQTRGGQQLLNGHVLWHTGPYTWCYKCGACTQGQVVDKLAGQCNRTWSNNYARSVRNRLEAGKHPKTGAWLAEPAPMSTAEWEKRTQLLQPADG